MTDDIDATIDKLHEAGANDDEITAILKEKFGAHAMGPVESASAQAPVQHGPQSGSSSALGLTGARAGMPVAANAAERFFTSPTLPKTTAMMGRIIGGVSAPVAGAATGGVTGALAGAAAASRSSWAGGKAGYFTGRMLQDVAEPVAKGLRAAVPYAEAAGKVAGPQGMLDLAQMAEPGRKDIGFMGIGPSVHVPGEEEPVLNALYRRLMERIHRR